MHVTIYNFDGASGLRNPLYARPQGVDGNSFQLDGKATDVINPDDTSHTFAVPALGLIVPITGVADDAKNQCGYAPCAMSMAHHTITFTFHTGKAGHYRWQCFVPCAAGWIDGFGGPMQTIGYMDGFLDVAWMATPGTREGNHAERVIVAAVVLSVVATALVAVLGGRFLPPGNGSTQATEQVFDNTWMTAISRL